MLWLLLPLSSSLSLSSLSISSAAGPARICSHIGLSTVVPPNYDMKLLQTYDEAKSICEVHSMSLSNRNDPWTSECSNSFAQKIERQFKVEVWDINDHVVADRNFPKRGVLCDILNYRECPVTTDV